MTADEAWLEELSLDDCETLLRDNSVGRIAFVTDEMLTILPVNYRVVESRGQTPAHWLALRTRPGNVIERASMMVAFEIDGIDAAHRQGWSVLVRGTLHHVDADAAGFRTRFDSDPWFAAERDAWLVVEPFSITGRRLHPRDPEWAFAPAAYL
jgi:nitroimidazol reductase NimA-like FMN-containing flavoprotein (pyridoxamine 5'-phosphate oxidase superfamily)